MSKILRVDSHQHFWKLARGDYHWLSSESSMLKRDFLPRELQPLLSQAFIDYTVTVQAAETIEETEFILGLASENQFIAGVVGWVDMDSPNAIITLEKLSQHSKLVGIRPVLQNIADPNWMLKPQLDPIFQWLINNNLCFDALVRPAHLAPLHTLLMRYPELKVVINHGAKPDIASNNFEPWAEKIQKIGNDSTAFCKLSGLLTEAADNDSYEILYPYMKHLTDCFGASRIMWGSDWPVCTSATTYNEWIACVQRFLRDFSLEDQQLIWGSNAIKFYKLNMI